MCQCPCAEHLPCHVIQPVWGWSQNPSLTERLSEAQNHLQGTHRCKINVKQRYSVSQKYDFYLLWKLYCVINLHSSLNINKKYLIYEFKIFTQKMLKIAYYLNNTNIICSCNFNVIEWNCFEVTKLSSLTLIVYGLLTSFNSLYHITELEDNVELSS